MNIESIGAFAQYRMLVDALRRKCVVTSEEDERRNSQTAGGGILKLYFHPGG